MREREREYSMGRGEDMSRVRIYRAERRWKVREEEWKGT
jgi:hypothetical protein